MGFSGVSNKDRTMGNIQNCDNGADNLTAIYEQMSRQCGILNISQPYRPPGPIKGIAFTCFYILAYHRHKPIDSIKMLA
jgi:hypothetical protein